MATTIVVVLLIITAIPTVIDVLYDIKVSNKRAMAHAPERVVWYYELPNPRVLECKVALGEVWVKLEGDTVRRVIDRIPVGMTFNADRLVGTTFSESKEIVCRARFRHLCLAS
jgi:hypothetical protein